MLDKFNRKINYLRISITDKCNLRCHYCMPDEGIPLKQHSEILSFEKIVEVVKVSVDMGINRIRLTGGEPLVRRNIVDLIAMISSIKGIDDLAVTTNGQLLSKLAEPLVQAGLQRVNISLDTINPIRYKKITRCGDLKKVLSGIQAAKNAGLQPIKINCVIQKNREEQDARQVTHFAQENDLIIRYIRQMDLTAGKYWVVDGGEGGNCQQCNRLRMTSDGRIVPCLFNDMSFSIHDYGIQTAIKMAVEQKPEFGMNSNNGNFWSIGG